MNDTGNTILLRLSIHCAISCGDIVVKFCNLARVALRGKGLGDGVLSMVVILPTEQSGSLSSSILTEGMLMVLGKLCEVTSIRIQFRKMKLLFAKFSAELIVHSRKKREQFPAFDKHFVAWSTAVPRVKKICNL